MNSEDYLMMTEAAKAIGAEDRRAAYRALRRAKVAGEEGMSVQLFGRTLIPKDKIEVLRRYYFPYYSDAHQAMVKVWGAKGGAASGVTKRNRHQQPAHDSQQTGEQHERPGSDRNPQPPEQVDYISRPPDLALGSYEAAALMGVHFTRPARMHAAGLIAGREAEAVASGSTRTFLIYSARSCEDDYEQYEKREGGRPRDWLDLRPEALKRIAKAKPAITYDDAIGVIEAARLLHVHFTAVYKLIEAGKLIARKPWNPRNTKTRVLIVSRKSCEQNRQEVAAAEKAGKKRGRKRYS